MITIRQKGDFSKTEKFLRHAKDFQVMNILNKYGARGVELLSAATPVRSGTTASSWSYEIGGSSGEYTIYYLNSNENKGVNIALILQYGHGTRQGGYVQGRDYINPALQTAFEEMANEAWKEVTST